MCARWNTLRWRHNGRDGVSNHPPHDCLLNRFIQTQINENITAPRHWPLCGEFTGEFPAQMASNAENVSISWRHHELKFNNRTVVNGYALSPITRCVCRVASLSCPLWAIVLKRKCHHFDEIFITGCIGSCHFTTSSAIIQISWKWRYFCFSLFCYIC